ncbi:MAG: YdcF family protein [Bacteroidota bacterium]
MKYDLNAISIRYFSISSIGNLIPIVLESIFLILVIALTFLKEDISISNKIFLFSLSTISLILLFAGYLHHKFDFINISNEYILGYAADKIITGISLSLGFFIHLFLLILLFNLFFIQTFLLYIRSTLMTIAILVIIFVAVFIFTTVQNFKEIDVKAGSNNVAVVLGAAVWHHDQPSPIFKGRIEKANHLYRDKIVYKIQLCGGNAPGEVSEAEAAQNYANSLGIKRYSLLIEDKTSTTAEQIKFIKNTLSPNPNYNEIFVISDQFHLSRVMEICKFFNVKATGVQSNYQINWEKLLYYRTRETVALINFWIFAL